MNGGQLERDDDYEINLKYAHKKDRDTDGLLEYRWMKVAIQKEKEESDLPEDVTNDLPF